MSMAGRRWIRYLFSRQLLLIIIIVFICVTMLHLYFKNSYVIPVNYSHKINEPITNFINIYKNSDTVNDPNSETKQVLLWFPFFGTPKWTLSKGSLENVHCPVKNCRATMNRANLTKFDAVVFHIPDPSVDQVHPPLPVKHVPNQRWILFTMEPSHHMKLDFQQYSGVFNWTATVRNDSDIPVDYGAIQGIQDVPENYVPLTKEMLNQQKPRLIAWAASNFVAPNLRIRLVKQLQEYISVDVYGSVQPYFENNGKPCQRFSADCDKLMKEYKFYLSLESTNCNNYITEKFWNALERGSIPIVMGGAGYEAAPPHSYISVKDFPSIKALAEYIEKVAGDVELYNSYMEWRKSYKVVYGDIRSALSQWGCRLCQALNDNTRPHQTYTDLQGWYNQDDATCHTHSWWRNMLANINVGFFRLGL